MTPVRRSIRILVCLWAAFAGPLERDVLFGQSVMVVGRVTDRTTSQPIAKALVVLRNPQRNVRDYRYTNEKGLYAFSSLSPGKYFLSVDASGFQPEEYSSIHLKSPIEANFELKPVKAAPAAVNCEKPLNESELVTLLRGGLHENRLRQIVTNCGISFRVDATAEKRLRAAGATDSLLDVLRRLPSSRSKTDRSS